MQFTTFINYKVNPVYSMTMIILKRRYYSCCWFCDYCYHYYYYSLNITPLQKIKWRTWNAKYLGLFKHLGQTVLIKARVKYGMQLWDTNILPVLLLKLTNQLLVLPQQAGHIIYTQCVLWVKFVKQENPLKCPVPYSNIQLYWVIVK